MNNEPSEIDNIDTVVSFWAIDETMQRLRGILKEIEKLCDPKGDDYVD
jgi:hypothetical protein